MITVKSFVAIVILGAASITVSGSLHAQTPLRDLTVGNRFVYNLCLIDTYDPSYYSGAICWGGNFYEDVLRDTVIQDIRYAIVYNSYDRVTRLERSDDSVIYTYKAGQEEKTYRFNISTNETMFAQPISSIGLDIYVSSVEYSFGNADTTISISMNSKGINILHSSSCIIRKKYGLVNAESYFSGHPAGMYRHTMSLVGARIKGEITGDTALPRITAQFPDIVSAIPGQTIELTFILRGTRLYAQNGISAAQYECSFNVSMLEPIAPTPQGSVREGKRTIPLTFALNTASDTAIVRLKFRALLSKDTSTGLQYSNISWKPQSKIGFPLLQNGTFRLLPILPISVKTQIDNQQAAVGREVSIPIILTGTRRLAELGITTGTATLSFNASLLQPVDATPRGEVSGGVRRIPIAFSFDKTSDTALVQLRFRVTLGNDTATVLKVDTVRVPDFVRIQQTTNNGTFHLLGLNYAGSTPALFLSDKALMSLTVQPNPFTQEVRLSFSLSKTATVEARVYAADGKLVATIQQGVTVVGQHEILWKACAEGGGELSSGVYTIHLLLDGQKAAEAMIVKTR